MGSTSSFLEADLLPLSGLQHLLFCERQCALIHIEQVWRENSLTASGRVFHERVDLAQGEVRRDHKIARGIPLRSLRLGLSGRADVMEFSRIRQGDHGAVIPGLEGKWIPFPVEYKLGRPKSNDCDRVQLCAQALCIEEMLEVEVQVGAIFYGRVRRREEVHFGPRLRELTQQAARRFHELVDCGKTPIAFREAKCRSCSLSEICLPPKQQQSRSVNDYLLGVLDDL